MAYRHWAPDELVDGRKLTLKAASEALAKRLIAETGHKESLSPALVALVSDIRNALMPSLMAIDRLEDDADDRGSEACRRKAIRAARGVERILALADALADALTSRGPA